MLGSTDEPGEQRATPESDARPDVAWLGTIGVTACMTLYTAVALVLAMLRAYSTPLAIVITAVLAMAVFAAAGPRRIVQSAPTARSQQWSVIAAVVLIGISAWVANDAGQHMLTGRDPGSYLTTARWLARDGSLDPAVTSPVLDQIPGVDYASPAVYGAGPDRIEFQFTHGSSTVMAAAYDLAGPRGLFSANALVGALGLFSIFVLLRRLSVLPPIALAAAAALGVSAPMLFITRNTYSEPYTLATLWAGLLVLSGPGMRRPTWGFVGGWLVGAGMLYRIDAMMYIAGLAIMLTVLSLRRGAPGRVLAATLAGAIVPAAIGLVDQRYFAGNYARDLESETRLLMLATAGSVALLVISRIEFRRLQRVVSDLGHRTATICAGVVAVALGVLWLVRPHVQQALADWDETSPYAKAVAAIQRRDGDPIKPLRSYAEYSVQQVQWYFGVPLLVFAIGGFAYITYRFLRQRRGEWNVLAPFIAVGAPLYLWLPRITPDQLWATRRFMPFVFPAFALAAAVGASALVGRVRAAGARTGIALLICGGIVVPTVIATWPVRDLADGRGSLAGVERACQEVEGAEAGIVAEGTRSAMALRAWCGSTVASLDSKAWDQGIVQFARATEASCTPAFLVASTPDSLEPVAASIDSMVEIRRIVGPVASPTLDRAVDRVGDQQFELVVARLTPEC